MVYLQVASKNAERRLEKLVQAGRETQRHLVAVIYEYSMQISAGRLRYLCRKVIDLHSEWKAGQSRIAGGGELRRAALL